MISAFYTLECPIVSCSRPKTVRIGLSQRILLYIPLYTICLWASVKPSIFSVDHQYPDITNQQTIKLTVIWGADLQLKGARSIRSYVLTVSTAFSTRTAALKDRAKTSINLSVWLSIITWLLSTFSSSTNGNFEIIQLLFSIHFCTEAASTTELS